MAKPNSNLVTNIVAALDQLHLTTEEARIAGADVNSI